MGTMECQYWEELSRQMRRESESLMDDYFSPNLWVVSLSLVSIVDRAQIKLCPCSKFLGKEALLQVYDT